MEPIFDSPSPWVADHIRTYVDSGGTKGNRLFDNDILLITTRGRKTGMLRRTPLMYGRDRDDYVVVGSYRGLPQHPCWYLNLATHPEVTLQIGAEIFAAKARTVTTDEKPPLWQMMISRFPAFESYQRQTTRQFPVVRLERTAAG